MRGGLRVLLGLPIPPLQGEGDRQPQAEGGGGSPRALRFVAPIEQLAVKAVSRMHGRYTAVHLRLEEDMLAKL